MSILLFNYGQADITPEEPVLLAGYANRRGMGLLIKRSFSRKTFSVKRG